jgi:hypothetical protein
MTAEKSGRYRYYKCNSFLQMGPTVSPHGEARYGGRASALEHRVVRFDFLPDAIVGYRKNAPKKPLS